MRKLRLNNGKWWAEASVPGQPDFPVLVPLLCTQLHFASVKAFGTGNMSRL